MRSNSHQYSSLVLSFQPRQMRANIREEVDQLKTHQPLPLSSRSPFSIFPPYLTPSPSFPKQKEPYSCSSSYCWDLPKCISHTHTYSTIYKQCCFGVSHSPFCQGISAAWASCLERVRTLVSSPLKEVSSSQDFILRLFIYEASLKGKIHKCVLWSLLNVLLNTKQLYKNFK